MKIGGKTLIERAIESARDCLYVDAPLVSSDDDAILDEALRLGVINHRRDEFASQDDSTAGDVIRDFLHATDVEIDPSVDPWIVYLQPTSPARTADMVEAAFDVLSEHQPHAKSLVSVTHPPKSPYWTLTVGVDGRLHPLFPEVYGLNRQQNDEAFMPNGAIYIFKLSEFLKTGKFPIDGAVPFFMSAEDSIDIDTLEDFERAKASLER
jgi:CMP-N-acetylneuraminic acid synthetase